MIERPRTSLLLSLLFMICLHPRARADVFSNVPEAAGYTLIYDLSPPENGNFTGNNVIPYTEDNSQTVLLNGFDRVAYYLELVTGTTTNWVYVSMDDFSHGSLKAVGLPHSTHNPVRHWGIVENMNVVSAAGAGVTTGTGIQTGNIEFWPSNYGGGNDKGIPNATSAWDWGDGGSSTASGYSSFQVHNHGVPEVIFAYNRWGNSGGPDCLGIGTAPSGNADYTFADNADSYSARRLQILVRERSGDPDTLAATVRSRVSEAATFELVQDLSIPTGGLSFNYATIPFTVDRAGSLVPSLGRLAYYLELDSEWVYVSMDAFSENPAQIGVPSGGANGNGGVTIQQLVTNMNVYAGGGAEALVATGTTLQTGNVEFWHRNYSQGNAIGIPGASGSTFDFGDTVSGSGDYGSMQLHNHGAGETIMSFSRWGSSGVNAALGFGNNPSGFPDWTHRETAQLYTTRRLQVLVQPRVYANVAEASDYVVVYGLEIPYRAAFRNSTPVPYTIDKSGTALEHGFDRVAYYLELDNGSGLEWVYVSMDDFTGGSLQAIGIPHNVDNPVAHWGIVNNMNVYASVGAGVTTGTGIRTGNIEMWPSNYNGNNGKGIPNSGSGYDWGDGNFNTSAGHGSFQIHNHGVPEVLFGYCNWGGNTGGQNGLGIGTQSGTTDWTSGNNTDSYVIKNLFILVRPRASAVDPDALATTVRSRVPEAEDYELVQDLHIPDGNLRYNSGFVPYNLDRRSEIFPSIGRIAYYLELDSDWVYVSMEGHTRDVTELGVPSGGPNGNGGTAFQQHLTNMNVYASTGAGVTTGTVIQTGNIEFWPWDYTAGNGIGIPGASGTTYDFGDTLGGGGNYGSMQVHNHGAAETIFSFSRWGSHSSGQSALGIGNNPGTHPDWTHQENANSYSTRHLQVLVQYGPQGHVPEAADYEIVYALAIPNVGNFRNSNPVPYAIDNSDMLLEDGFDRVAYYLEIDTGSGLEWVYVSMDDFSGQSLTRLGLPHNTDNPVAHQRIVNNMNVYASSGANVTTGTGLDTGNIEMWPGNFDGINAMGIPNASNAAGNRDFGDQNAGGVGAGYGSFQVCNHDLDGTGPGTAGEVIFAYNRFGNTGTSDLGTGNDPNTARGLYNTDWTFAQNANSYTIKNLFVLVRPRAVDPNTLAAPLRERVPESEDYELVYDLSIPTRANWNYTSIPYTVDRSAVVPPSFGRIAYYLELDSAWAYASMDAFTQDPGAIGVPSGGVNGNGNIVIRQFVTDMNVRASSGSSVVVGDGIETGNIEFWPRSYGGNNTLPVPNATGSYDFGDDPSGSGDYGSMQLHNHDTDGAGPGTSGQTIFSYSRWGNSLGNESGLGFGNRPSGDPDWTHADNAGTYTTRRLQVLVLPRVFDDVSGAQDFSLLYLLEVPTNAPTDFHANGVPYTIDRSEELSGLRLHRVAYYLELKKPGGNREWVYAEFDPFTQDVTKLGVPNSDVGRVWQRNVRNLTVYAGGGAEARVTTGTRITTGNIEFWPNNYGPANEASVPGASGSAYDFGDDVNEGVTSGHGSMQVHNHGAAEVIFAYNAWGSSGSIGELGIGSQGAAEPDWTFNDNANQYEIANLYVLIQTPPPISQFILR
jgi:hypothetical protein